MKARSILSSILTTALLIAALLVIVSQQRATDQRGARSHEVAQASGTGNATTHITYGPQSLEEMKGWAHEIAIGRVTSIEETNTNGYRGQYVTLEMQQRLKGTVERSLRLYYPGMELGHGPAYVTGERYLLFLDRDEHDDFYMVVTPEGRYRIAQNGKVSPISERPYAKALEGKDIAEVVRMIEKPGK